MSVDSLEAAPGVDASTPGAASPVPGEPRATRTQPDGSTTATEVDPETAAAVFSVEQRMNEFVTLVRLNIRDAALAIDPSLPPFALKVLRVLDRLGPTHSSELAQQLLVDRSAMSRQIRQLSDLGLVDCDTDPKDGRARILSVTELAKERMSTTRDAELFVQRRLQSWSVEDLESFAGYLARLTVAR